METGEGSPKGERERERESEREIEREREAEVDESTQENGTAVLCSQELGDNGGFVGESWSIACLTAALRWTKTRKRGNSEQGQSGVVGG